MENGLVLYEKADHIVTITMNRPEKMNAVNQQMKEELLQSWRQFRDDDDAWVAILTGAGKAFSAGGDLKETVARHEGRAADLEWPKGRAVRAPTTFSDWVWEEDVRKPVIAAVNGYAGGGGFAMALNCDIRIASETAEMGSTNVRWSHMAGGQGFILPRIVPLGWAFWLIFTGQTIDAETAYRIGLVQQVTAPDKLMDSALELAATICANGPLVAQYNKEFVYRSLDVPLSSGRFIERILYEQLRHRPEYQEGSKAFIEKRDPKYSAT